MMLSNRAFHKQVWVKLLACFFVLAFFFLPSFHADAHASLVQASPDANSQLSKAPAEIKLTFNERLEKELYWIKLIDQKGREITQTKTRMSKDQRTLSLKVPKLKKGTYTVSYHIVSADGHPVESSYLFSVGNSDLDQTGAAAGADQEQHVSIGNALLRAFYYFLLLSLTGWIFWRLMMRKHGFPNRETESFWFKYIQGFFALSAVCLGFVQLFSAVDSFNLSSIGHALFSTTFGISVLMLFFLAVSAICLRRLPWFDALWVIAAVVFEGFNGHALSLKPVAVNVILDIIHLFAASLWTGGLLLIITHWRKEQLKDFVPVFSKAAFVSLIVLVISGLWTTINFLPSLTDLFVTAWGILLLIKTGCVILVFVVGAVLRNRLKKQDAKGFRHWFKYDFTLMVIIVIIVGALTYSSPLPKNEPFKLHSNKNGLNMTAMITPKNPGVNNTFTVKVKTKHDLQYVQLYLKHAGKTDIPKVKVPLKGKKTNGIYTYQGQGSYLSVPGQWTVEIRIMNENDDETVWDKQMKVYQVNQ
ncbi:copper transport protein [Scopulibacillus daqui]|uniref:Copper transport protein n=1 Tax=Scopulibacillus daqui TaxID=1469162 RepID=A0ABS2PWN7_9BACL|nr:copper resistance protein CopC [Scopulibacillus daqui]MBM7644125.1 copper transport protein [Scopulibacillus daqui]